MRKQGRQFEMVARWLALALLLVSLSGCGNQDEIYPANAVYRVTVTNLTFNQAFSTVAVIVHTAGYQAWEGDTPATQEIERLAEGGELARGTNTNPDGKWLLTEALKDPAVVLVKATLNSATGQAQGIYGGGQAHVNMGVAPGGDYRLTVATKLMFTNDGFTGVADLSIALMEIGDSISLYTDAYDAGTEDNTETEMTVPGFFAYTFDADGNEVKDEFGQFVPSKGEGYNPGPDVKDNIDIHHGVITKDDPLGDLDGSGLNETHRFLQPVAKITVERIS